MTVGYSSLDPLSLKMKQENGSEELKKDIDKIMEVIADRHLMLTTLLLSNAVAMESLPIFLDAIMPSSLAILLSTTVVLIFGEVLPQAFCLGPRQIQIAAFVSPFIKVQIKLMYIICYPIAKGLDLILGVHTSQIVLAKKDLKALIKLQKSDFKRK